MASASSLEERGVVVLPSPAVTDELLEDLAAGLDALPPAARLTPLEVELHDEATPLGLGDATHPALTLGPTRLHLYAYREADDARAAARLGSLSADQRKRLWRRRAVVHALIARWDERLRWSSRAGWRSLAGWDGDVPLLVYPWAFSRRDGMNSAALDLATFAEELLVPAESMVEDAVPLDDRLRCREPSKARFLDERLAAIDPSWEPARTACPRFESWADLEHLPRFEVIYASPSSSSAQAVFGHLLLRLVRDDDEGPASVQVMQLAALISPLEPATSYILRGVGGGFRGVFSIARLADVQQEALGLEQRMLHRFRLELTVEQRRRLLERMWELERVGYIDYRFFKANCATMLRFLLTPALGEQAAGPPLTPWETPTQVLDGLAGVLGAVETDESSGTVASKARERRRALVSGELLVALEGDPAQRRAAYRCLSPSLCAAGNGELAPRGKGGRDEAPTVTDFETVSGRPLPDPLPLGEREAAARARVLLASLRIERFALDQATAARIKAERATVLPGWTGPTTDELVAARQRRYQHETSARARAQVELAALLALDELLRAAPRRPFDAWERAALDAEREARETFEAVADAVASLPEDALAQARAEELEVALVFQAETNRRAVPEGGHGHGSLGLGILSTGTPVLRMRAAALAEQLGDQRKRGFGSRSAWRALDAAVELEVASQPVHRAAFTVAHARGVSDTGWGWGAGLDYSFERRAHEVAASGERLWAVAADQRFTNFLMLNLGLRIGARVDQLVNAVAYPRAGLAFRVQLPGSFGNAVRFEGAYLPRLRAGNGAFGFEHGAVGAVQVHVRLGVIGGVALTARADVQAEWRPTTGFSGVAALGVDFD